MASSDLYPLTCLAWVILPASIALRVRDTQAPQSNGKVALPWGTQSHCFTQIFKNLWMLSFSSIFIKLKKKKKLEKKHLNYMIKRWPGEA